MHHNVMITGLV